MANEEAIKLLNQEKIPMIVDGKPNEHLAVAHIKAIEALEENTKLKAEIDRLKLELEQSVKLPFLLSNKKLFTLDQNYDEIYELDSSEVTIRLMPIDNKILYEIDCFEFYEEDFGKTIFLSREEAEQSLKGQVK